MRQLRAKVEGAYYHATSRCAFQTFAFEAESKDMFVKIMRRAEAFSGVRIANYCIMDNHFHILVKVPVPKPVDDAELDRRIAILYGDSKSPSIFKRWEELEKSGGGAIVKRERDAYRARMYDISQFMKTLKQRFSLWYTTHHGNLEGSIWQGRFHSTLVEGSASALSAVSAYIDLNSVRANITREAKNYAWCGYAAAAKGDAKAREGIAGIFAEGVGIENRDKAKSRNEAWRLYSQMLACRRDNADAVIEGKSDAAVKHVAVAAKDGNREASAIVAKMLAVREGKLSRGLVFGSPKYVDEIIARFRDVATTRTCIIVYGTSGGTMLCCTGRRERDNDDMGAIG